MQIAQYLEQVRAQYASGRATEHSYRPALYALFQSIDAKLTVINEPKQSEGGMPDFMFQRHGVPIGWAEAKDIDKDVIKLKGYSVDQRKRYEAAYPNLIYTNGVDFEFLRDGEQVHFVSIAEFQPGLPPLSDNFEELERQLKRFAEQKPISIKSASKLAEMMAAKAAIIKDEVGLALKEDPEFRSALGGQFKSFKANLLPHLTPDEFADIYAETITYGMFAARLHDDVLETFSRQEALEKLPASNPFLKGLFEYVAGPALPKRLTYIVDDLVQVMRASDPQSLFRASASSPPAMTPSSTSTKTFSPPIIRRSGKAGASGTRPSPWSISSSALSMTCSRPSSAWPTVWPILQRSRSIGTPARTTKRASRSPKSARSTGCKSSTRPPAPAPFWPRRFS